MLRLEMPRRATINESPQLARLVGEAEREKGPLTIDCVKTEAWGPFGVALIASCLAIRKRSGRDTELVAPTADEAAEQFDETGLPLLLSGESAELNGEQVHPITMEAHEPSHELAAALSSPLSAAVQAAPAVVTPCLETLLDNLFEWSESSVGGFAVVRWHKKTRQVRLALIDRGLGIPAVLRRSQVGNLIRASDVEAIEAAFSDPAVTSRPQGTEGLGLKQLRDNVLSHKGKLTVVSLGAKISWVGDKITKSPSPALRGTAIEIDMSV
ncbi:MAG TPA: ATP-binding protein [Polyangiaceae bacterium]